LRSIDNGSNVRQHSGDVPNLQIRFEAFNSLNHPNFGRPDSTFTDKSFGKISGTATIMQQIQVAMKYVF
jgi:hypothetical protein